MEKKTDFIRQACLQILQKEEHVRCNIATKEMMHFIHVKQNILLQSTQTQNTGSKKKCIGYKS